MTCYKTLKYVIITMDELNVGEFTGNQLVSIRHIPYQYFGFGDRGGFINSIRRKVAPYRFSLAADSIIKETGLTVNSHVLEIGCGVGLLNEAIKEKIPLNSHYFGIDLDFDPALKASKARGLSVAQADATDLPFQDEEFDCVVSTDVFEHIPNAEKLVRETRRVLKPGRKAFIVIADPSEGRFEEVPDHIKRTSGNSDVSFWTELFEKNGFKIMLESEHYRKMDWRKIFNLPVLRKVKNRPIISCAFNIVDRPGVYILEKVQLPQDTQYAGGTS